MGANTSKPHKGEVPKAIHQTKHESCGIKGPQIFRVDSAVWTFPIFGRNATHIGTKCRVDNVGNSRLACIHNATSWCMLLWAQVGEWGAVAEWAELCCKLQEEPSIEHYMCWCVLVQAGHFQNRMYIRHDKKSTTREMKFSALWLRWTLHWLVPTDCWTSIGSITFEVASKVIPRGTEDMISQHVCWQKNRWNEEKQRLKWGMEPQDCDKRRLVPFPNARGPAQIVPLAQEIFKPHYV